MLTFFRRIRRGLISQSKLSRYLIYAIGEIVLVVIGILIALQINNWNERAKIRETEKDILYNLRAELMSNQDRLKASIDIHKSEYENGLILLSLFNTDISHLPEPKLDSLVGNIEGGHTFEANQGYIKSLIASNKIDYIQNEDLKSYISSFESMVIDATQEVDDVKRLLNERLWPAIDGKLSGLNRLRTFPGFQEFPRGTYKSDYDWFLGNREMEDLVSNIISWKVETIKDEEILSEAIEDMVSIIDSEL